MELGAVFPQTEFGDDPGAVREWTLAVEAMGFDHVYVYDHVVGANTASRPDWNGPYNLDSQFYEPLVLFSYMGAVSQKLGFLSGVVILPQRQTTLFAKQAACVDVLCNGRLRIGIGTGWNQVEYEALGVKYEDRGDIFDEQIEVMRALWTQRAVTVKMRHHTITDAGLMPMPIQKPIPLWLGGGGAIPINNTTGSERVLRRVGRVADGWLPICQPDSTGLALKDRIFKYAREAGRDLSKIGIEGRIDGHRKNQDQWADLRAAWKNFGATHLSVNTMRDGLKGPEQHLRRLEDVRKIL